MNFLNKNKLNFLIKYEKDLNIDQILDLFKTKIKTIENPKNQEEYENLLFEIIGKMAYLDDQINAKIYKSILSFDINKLEQIKKFIQKWKQIDKVEFNQQIFGTSINFMMSDREIYEAENLYDLIDESIKNHGMVSEFIHLVGPWFSSSGQYLELNDSVTGFKNQYEKSDLINEFKKELAKRDFDDLLNPDYY